jgi:tRNA pseudouridine13 synthase
MKIKQIPEDFEVHEIFEKQKPKPGHRTEDSDYVWFTLMKRDYDLFRAIKMIAARSGVSVKRFGYAGTKDKRAVTYQKVSAWKVPRERLESLRIKDMELSGFEERRERINLGDLKSNKFVIVVRDIGVDAKRLDKFLSARLGDLKKNGVVNFYGDQRFGGNRSVTHLVGKSIIKGDLKSAVWDYLIVTSGDEHKDTKKFRKELQKTGDVKAALKDMPKGLRFERMMLEHLANTPNDFGGALRRLPRNLKRMFVHAYQSWLWNETAKLLLAEQKRQSVKSVMIPLVGYKTKLSSYPESKDIISRILDSEGVRIEGFHVITMPELGSEGADRELLIFPQGLGFSVDADELNPGKSKVILKFTVPAGSYATVVIDAVFEGMS